MLETIKTQFVNLLRELGYNVTDNGTYQENFPWLMVRTGGYRSFFSYDLKYDFITLTLDIFSKYNGEKEIIEISENILNHIQGLRLANENITAIAQDSCHILGDKKTGPVRQHGVITYQFVLTSKLEEDNDESTTGN